MKNYGSHSKSCRPCSTTSCNTTGEQATTDIFINLRVEPNERDALQKHEHERTGRPLGGNGFISQLEARTGRMLKKRKPAQKGQGNNDNFVSCPRALVSPELPNSHPTLFTSYWGKAKETIVQQHLSESLNEQGLLAYQRQACLFLPVHFESPLAS